MAGKIGIMQEGEDSTQERVEKLMRDPALRREWLRQKNMMCVGLIGIGTIMVQPFLSDLSTSATPPGKVCLISFAVAIPLLAALIMVNWQEIFRGRETRSRTVLVAWPVAQAASFVGVVAGFWHIWWVAGVVMLLFGLIAVGVHSAGYTRLELDGESGGPE
ncbi:hypothetical protein ABGB12_12260 [Actinocorallia sp. B10E7]|uniref:hypothetical protein n=1 Tax=Actinocorallia sp. B10E7 TaxID=3153558 RepID=UPI00325EF418